jgi:hypothetical protein
LGQDPNPHLPGRAFVVPALAVASVVSTGTALADALTQAFSSVFFSAAGIDGRYWHIRGPFSWRMTPALW